MRPLASFSDCEVSPEMVIIPLGTFVMESSQHERDSLSVMNLFDQMESPEHVVRIAYFFAVGRYSVTFDKWDSCIADGGCNCHVPDDAG